jgi:ATP-dependent Clp protease ATP-binding subunit ClpA
MARLIQEKVKQPLAEELLFGKLAHGGEVLVKTKPGDNGKLELSFELTPAPPKLVRKSAKAAPKRKPKAQPETSEEE